MGNTQTEPKYTHSDLLLNNTLSHPTLSRARLTQSNKGNNLLLSFPIPDSSILDKWKEDIEKHRIKFQNIDAIFVPESLDYNKDSICGSTGSIEANYKQFALVLDDQIQNRIRIMQPFSEQQVWYLFYFLAHVASQLHKKNLIIGDVRPKNILMGVDGQISFICKASFLDQQTNFKKSLQTKQKTFLSPEQAHAILERKVSCQNQTESQCFSIGMTMMSIMLLHNEQILYFSDSVQQRNSENFVFHYEKFERELYELANCEFYSKFMREIVMALLEINVNERIKMSQIYEILKHYESNIINFDSFKPNYQALRKKNIPTISTKTLKMTSSHKYNPSRHSKNELKFSNYLSPNTQSFSKYPNNENNGSMKSSNATPYHEASKSYMINKTLEEQVEQKSYYDTHKQVNNHNEMANQQMEEIKNPNKIARSMDLTVKSYATPIQNLNDSSQREESFSYKNKNSPIIQSDSPYKNKVTEIRQNLYQAGEVSGKNFSREMSFGEGSLAIQKNEQLGLRKLDETARQANSIKDSSLFEKKSSNFSNFLTGVDELLENSRRMFPNES